MRVLEIVADGSPGGGTTHVLQILNGLHDSTSFELVTQTGSCLLQEAESRGVSCHALDFFYSRLNPVIPIQLRRICSRQKPDVVHVHGGRAGFFLTLAHIDLPTLYTVHGFHFLQKSLIGKWFALQAERYIVQRANRIIFVSQYDVALAGRFGLLDSMTPHELIYNGIATVHDSPQLQCLDLQHIGFIGRLEPQKDPELFLDALEYLPEYSATIVGAGSLETLIRGEIARRGLINRVRMQGGLSHAETLKVISTLSALVLSSRWEGLPLIALEAMWMGVPVVSMDISGMSEVIEDEFNGILVKQRAGEHLADGVKKITEEPFLRARIIQNAQAKVKEKFSEKQMLQSLHRVYQEMQ